VFQIFRPCLLVPGYSYGKVFVQQSLDTINILFLSTITLNTHLTYLYGGTCTQTLITADKCKARHCEVDTQIRERAVVTLLCLQRTNSVHVTCEAVTSDRVPILHVSATEQEDAAEEGEHKQRAMMDYPV
jgi:hypothetical protein